MVYENKIAGIKLASTLTFPQNGENFPSVILITGSGAQDRDETIFEHRSFSPMVATKSKDVAFIVLLAVPGIIGEQILYEQGKLINKAAEMTDDQAQQNQKMQEAIFYIILTETGSLKKIDRLQKTFTNGMYFMMNDEQKKAIDNQIKLVDNV